MNKNILVTGGTGFIGIHTVVCLLEAGYDITVVDNLVNSSQEAINRAITITKVDPSRLRFFQVNICHEDKLEEVFKQSPTFAACIHFAGLKAVGESVANPVLYYENNVMGTLVLLRLMSKYNCRSIVFSSSATVYGDAVAPIPESSLAGVGIVNPYGRTKYFIEEILKDFKKEKELENTSNDPNKDFSVVILRYFNPVGAHPSGLMGEDPNGVPNNLMPFVAQVVVGRREKLMVFGNDYPTKDGTGVRDYIHVMDLGEGHLAALQYIEQGKMNAQGKNGYGKLSIFNLGGGKGHSVLEMIEAMKRASGRPLPYEFAPRRAGDLAEYYADPSFSKSELGWEAKRGLDEMCRDVWNWQSKNPQGYKSVEK